MVNRQIDKKTMKQVLVEQELHYRLKMYAAKHKTKIKEVVEGLIIDLLAKEI